MPQIFLCHGVNSAFWCVWPQGYGPGASEVALDPSELRRLGVLGIGRDFDAELAVRAGEKWTMHQLHDCVCTCFSHANRGML